ncbi:MAG: hypothetical protein L0G96_10850, partial [Acinetobacter sp.]|nr:hypothetical protein [Acinetobacter sp.]
DNAFELDEFLFIGHSLPDDQIGKAQIIGNFLQKDKNIRHYKAVDDLKISEHIVKQFLQKKADKYCQFGQSTVI